MQHNDNINNNTSIQSSDNGNKFKKYLQRLKYFMPNIPLTLKKHNFEFEFGDI